MVNYIIQINFFLFKKTSLKLDKTVFHSEYHSYCDLGLLKKQQIAFRKKDRKTESKKGRGKKERKKLKKQTNKQTNKHTHRQAYIQTQE